jgi:PhzF family phenazine biosynthesis protein
MQLSFTTLDVFTATRYNGNPLAIIRVPASEKTNLTQEQKLKIAAEFNLSEIVFLHIPAPASDFKEVDIDIFTSLAEVPFAGHPTIGTSHYLLNELGEETEAIVTKAGRIPIEKDRLNREVKAVSSDEPDFPETLSYRITSEQVLIVRNPDHSP